METCARLSGEEATTRKRVYDQVVAGARATRRDKRSARGVCGGRMAPARKEEGRGDGRAPLPAVTRVLRDVKKAKNQHVAHSASERGDEAERGTALRTQVPYSCPALSFPVTGRNASNGSTTPSRPSSSGTTGGARSWALELVRARAPLSALRSGTSPDADDDEAADDSVPEADDDDAGTEADQAAMREALASGRSGLGGRTGGASAGGGAGSERGRREGRSKLESGSGKRRLSSGASSVREAERGKGAEGEGLTGSAGTSRQCCAFSLTTTTGARLAPTLRR